MSKVSIIVPVYNAGRYLSKCIQSIVNQTFIDIEIILVNDGSIDNSLKICNKFKIKDHRIIVIDKQNEGSIKARRSGVETATSDYIMFVDADDWIDILTIEILYNKTIKTNSDVTVSNLNKFIGNGLYYSKKIDSPYFKQNKIYENEDIKNHLITAYFHGHPFPSSLCAKLYRKELLINSGKYLDRIKFLGDDLFYNMEILLKANRVNVVDEALYYYRLGGFTSKYMPYLFDDMVNGYLIQKEVINEYFNQEHMNGISIMLLNTLKTCLYNLSNSNMNTTERYALIKEYCSHDVILECVNNYGSIKYFDKEYLEAIKKQDLPYLDQIGINKYRKNKTKKKIIGLASKLAIV